MNIYLSAFFILTSIGSLTILINGILSKRNSIRKPISNCLILIGVCGLVWSLLGILTDIFSVTSTSLPIVKHYIGGITIGVFFSIVVSGQFGLLKEKIK
jgi:hypothetical protein